MKSILIIGMGKFGHHLCTELIKGNNEVMVMDINEEKVRDLIYDVSKAQVGDCSDPKILKGINVPQFDIVFVCIGTNFQSSLEITCLVKEMGAKYVVSKANRDVHAKFLLRNGADDVIYPDRDTAERASKKYSANHVLDYVALDDNYSIYEINPPQEWVGKTICENNVRQNYNINIITLKADGGSRILPPPDHCIKVTCLWSWERTQMWKSLCSSYKSCGYIQGYVGKGYIKCAVRKQIAKIWKLF